MSLAEPVWATPPQMLSLTQEVQIWRANLDLPLTQIEQLVPTLSSDEQQRADRFRFPVDRQRFIASRGILRTLLGRYLKIEPADLRFSYGDHGKPSVDTLHHPSTLQFNLSHSQAWLLCAMTQQHSVGIDLECLRSLTDLEGLTRRFFAPAEHQAIHTLPMEQRSRAFFQYWTCKEALLKASGKGLIDLSSVEIAITNETIELIRWADDPVHSTWQIYSFTPTPDAVAAIAINTQAPQFSFWQWQELES